MNSNFHLLHCYIKQRYNEVIWKLHFSFIIRIQIFPHALSLKPNSLFLFLFFPRPLFNVKNLEESKIKIASGIKWLNNSYGLVKEVMMNLINMYREKSYYFSWLVVLIEDVTLDVPHPNQPAESFFKDRFNFKPEEKLQDIATFMVNMMVSLHYSN